MSNGSVTSGEYENPVFLHVALLKVVLNVLVLGFVVARLTWEGSVYISHIGVQNEVVYHW